jgi:hypothetical protein
VCVCVCVCARARVFVCVCERVCAHIHYRKPSECLIGILKARFRLLKHPILLHKKRDIANVLYVCAVLHNMLLHFDGLDMLWTEEDWLTQDPEDSDQAEDIESKKRRLIPPERLHEFVLPERPDSEPTIVETKHHELRIALITNLKHLWDQGLVEHLRYPNKTCN